MKSIHKEAYLPPIITACCLTIGTAGLGLLGGATDTDRGTTGRPPVQSPVPTSIPPPVNESTTTVAIVDSTTAPATTVSATTTTISTDDFASSFIDTNDLAAVKRAWTQAQERPRHRMDWTGSTSSCRAGDTSILFKTEVLTRVQWFRAMAGVSPAIHLDRESSRLAQEAALVMAAAGDLSHEPGESWPCYSEDAYTGASHSNLFLGVFGVDAIDGYIEDFGSDNLPVGHRRWILDPTLASIGTGDTRRSNALFVINDEINEDAPVREPDGFVMWPPRGHVPRAQIYERWSVSHASADFSGATVTVFHDGRTRIFREPHTDSEGYGGLNTLVFEWRRPSRGSGPVRVRVDGIELGGARLTLRYEVKPFG